MSMLKTSSLIKSLDFAKISKVLVSFSSVVVAFGFIYCVLFNNYGGFLLSFNSSCINGNGIATSSRVETDTDVMWFRDPLPIFTEEFDFQLSCDHFNGKENDLKNHPNVGLMYIKSNNRTIKFYDFWVKARPYFPRMHEQDVFNVLKRRQYIKEIGLKVRFLDTDYFGGFCTPSKDFNKVCTMHANCRVGLPRKIADLNTTLEDWKNYTLSSNKTSMQFKWRIENA